tara:strand:- start:245 stop:397 length:153 start_codon:yes stop_codon:yes gene_type:complete
MPNRNYLYATLKELQKLNRKKKSFERDLKLIQNKITKAESILSVRLSKNA